MFNIFGKGKKEEAALRYYTRDVKLDQEIELLKSEGAKLSKRLQTLVEGTPAYEETLTKLREKGKRLKEKQTMRRTTRGMNDAVGAPETGSIITESTEDYLAGYMKDLDIITSPEKSDGEKMSEEEIMRTRMSLETKARARANTKSTGGTALNWEAIIPQDDDYDYSEEDEESPEELFAFFENANSSKSASKSSKTNPANANWGD